MRTMIVDDEPLAVEELADTCEQFEDVQIVGRFFFFFCMQRRL